MKFSDFVVRRVNNYVVLQGKADADKVGGMTLDVMLDMEGNPARADAYEQFFSHLVKCAQFCEAIPPDALDATVQLTKGTDHEQ